MTGAWMIRPVIKVLPILIGLLLVSPLRADRIELRDGRVIEGVLLDSPGANPAAESIRVRIGSSIITLPRANLQSVTPDSPGGNAVIRARDELQAGRITQALEFIEAAIAQGPPGEALAALVLDHGMPLVIAAASLPPGDRARLSRLLQVLAAAAPDNAPLRIRRWQLHLGLGEDAQAEALWSLLPVDLLQTDPGLREQVAGMLISQIDKASAAGDPERARAALEHLARIDAELADGRRIQFLLEQGWQRRRAEQYEEALELYSRELLPLSREIGRDRIAMTLQAAERALRSKDEFPRAAELYERYGLPVIPEEAREHIVDIWRDEGWRRMRREDFDGAAEAFARAEAVIPGAADADRLQLEFRRRLMLAVNESPAVRFELANWAYEQGLLEEAVALFHDLAGDPRYGEAARAYENQLRNLLAEQKLSAMLDLYEAREYGQVLRDVGAFLGGDYPVGFKQQALEIQKLTRDAIAVLVAEEAQQAESMLQQAQRAFFREDYAEAEQLLDVIEERYRNTVVYERAAEFRSLVGQKLALARLERGQQQTLAGGAQADASDAAGGADAGRAEQAPPPAADAPADDTRMMESELDNLMRTLKRGNLAAQVQPATANRPAVSGTLPEYSPGELKARGLLDQARQAYFDGRIGEADELLAEIRDDYASTPAAEEAARFYQLIRDQIELHERRAAAAASDPPRPAAEPTTGTLPLAAPAGSEDFTQPR